MLCAYSIAYSLAIDANSESLYSSVDRDMVKFEKEVIGEVLGIDFADFYITEKRPIVNQEAFYELGDLEKQAVLKHGWFIGDIITGTIHEGAMYASRVDLILEAIPKLYNLFMEQHEVADLVGVPYQDVLLDVRKRLLALEKQVKAIT